MAARIDERAQVGETGGEGEGGGGEEESHLLDSDGKQSRAMKEGCAGQEVEQSMLRVCGDDEAGGERGKEERIWWGVSRRGRAGLGEGGSGGRREH